MFEFSVYMFILFLNFILYYSAFGFPALSVLLTSQAYTVCPEKKTKIFLVISSLKVVQF